MSVRRRLICAVGFIIEATTIIASFFFFNWVRLNRIHTMTNNALFLVVSLPSWMTVICIICILWSHYLWLMLDVTKTFSSDVERHGWVLRQQNSMLDHSSPKSSYTSNGRYLKMPSFLVSRFYKDGIPASMLPMIGLVKDLKESETQKYVIFNNLVTGKQMIVCRADGGKFRLRHFNRLEVEDTLENGGSNKFNFCPLNTSINVSMKFM